jgi:hypothetical protein
MDETELARTEAAFREVNEAIAKTAERFEADEADFVCECADPSCAHRVSADLDDYERVRAEPTTFLLAPGHELEGLEQVVERNNGFEVAEKTGEAEQVARETDPRADGN